MNHRTVLFALAGVAMASQAVFADELRPIQAYSVHLGSVSGSVYFDTQGSDDRLVATLSGGPDMVPVRMVTTLAPGQTTIISVPRAVGEPALEVTFARHGDKVFATEGDTVVGSIH